MQDCGLIGHYNPLVKKVCGRDYLGGAMEWKERQRRKNQGEKEATTEKGYIRE